MIIDNNGVEVETPCKAKRFVHVMSHILERYATTHAESQWPISEASYSTGLPQEPYTNPTYIAKKVILTPNSSLSRLLSSGSTIVLALSFKAY
jgi:hypothetical protein